MCDLRCEYVWSRASQFGGLGFRVEGLEFRVLGSGLETGGCRGFGANALDATS